MALKKQFKISLEIIIKLLRIYFFVFHVALIIIIMFLSF